MKDLSAEDAADLELASEEQERTSPTWNGPPRKRPSSSW